MTITTRAQVRAAYERALQLGGDCEDAIEAVAQSLGLPPEAVAEAVETVAAALALPLEAVLDAITHEPSAA